MKYTTVGIVDDVNELRQALEEIVSSTNVSGIDQLSYREKRILEELARGLMYKEIANVLFIRPETVRKHVYQIYEKLHVTNRVEAVNKFLGR